MVDGDGGQVSNTDTKPVRYMPNETSPVTGQMGGWLFRKGNKARHPVYGNVVVVSDYANSWFNDSVEIRREYSTNNVTVRSSELIVEEEKVSGFGANKEFGVARKSPSLDAKLTLGANNSKDRSKGVYVRLYDGRDSAFGRFDVDLIPSIIEHLQGIYDGFPKEKTTQDILRYLPFGAMFRIKNDHRDESYVVTVPGSKFTSSDGITFSLVSFDNYDVVEVIK